MTNNPCRYLKLRDGSGYVWVQLPDDLVGFSGKETYCEGCGEFLDYENAALCKRCAP